MISLGVGPVTDPGHVAAFYRSFRLTDSGCWEWTGGKVKGYGRLGFEGSELRAHRLSWAIHKGRVPTGVSVLHVCDNPPCVNPEHLFLGTQTDNVADREAKGRGRWARGQGASGTKLSDDEVKEIRKLHGSTTQRAVGARFKVHHSTIGQIWRRTTWKHL